jgi:hypothetical protein
MAALAVVAVVAARGSLVVRTVSRSVAAQCAPGLRALDSVCMWVVKVQGSRGPVPRDLAVVAHHTRVF